MFSITWLISLYFRFAFKYDSGGKGDHVRENVWKLLELGLILGYFSIPVYLTKSDTVVKIALQVERTVLVDVQ